MKRGESGIADRSFTAKFRKFSLETSDFGGFGRDLGFRLIKFLFPTQSPFALSFEFGETARGLIRPALSVVQFGVSDSKALCNREFFVKLFLEAGLFLAFTGDLLLVGALLSEAILGVSFLHFLDESDGSTDDRSSGTTNGGTRCGVTGSGIIAYNGSTEGTSGAANTGAFGCFRRSNFASGQDDKGKEDGGGDGSSHYRATNVFHRKAVEVKRS
jgi:hypothetical protein